MVNVTSTIKPSNHLAIKPSSSMLQEENTLLDKILENRVLSHILFWLFILILAPLDSSDTIQVNQEVFIYRLIGIPMKIAATYFLVYYLIPRFFNTKKYLLFLIYLIGASVLFTIIYRFNNIYIAETLAGSTQPKESLWDIIYNIDQTFFGYIERLYDYSFLFIIIKIFKDREVKKREIEVLGKEKAQTELNFLKAQIHPHFLFNTLNNLYALTLTKSDDAPEVVAKLSEMLDYMLYQCRDPKVTITKEVDLLQNYITLEKLRYGDRLTVEFEQTIDDPHISIAPLILISIVENAFKHGASGAMQTSVIRLTLLIKEGILHFQVFNTKANKAQTDERAYKKGIGVKNIQRQLELIYPNQYEWQVEETGTTYRVNLKLEL